jgi:hypothetical protein
MLLVCVFSALLTVAFGFRLIEYRNRHGDSGAGLSAFVFLYGSRSLRGRCCRLIEEVSGVPRRMRAARARRLSCGLVTTPLYPICLAFAALSCGIERISI